jgi:hypothetical protein
MASLHSSGQHKLIFCLHSRILTDIQNKQFHVLCAHPVCDLETVEVGRAQAVVLGGDVSGYEVVLFTTAACMFPKFVAHRAG